MLPSPWTSHFLSDGPASSFLEMARLSLTSQSWEKGMMPVLESAGLPGKPLQRRMMVVFVMINPWGEDVREHSRVILRAVAKETR